MLNTNCCRVSSSYKLTAFDRGIVYTRDTLTKKESHIGSIVLYKRGPTCVAIKRPLLLLLLKRNW